VSEARPQEEWERVEVPKLRIVSRNSGMPCRPGSSTSREAKRGPTGRNESYHRKSIVFVQWVAVVRTVQIAARDHQRGAASEPMCATDAPATGTVAYATTP